MDIDTEARRGAKPACTPSDGAASLIGPLRRHGMLGMARAPGLCAGNPVGLRDAMARAPANAPASAHLATAQDAVSSDARKGPGFGPDPQPRADRDGGQRARRAAP